MNQNSQAIAQPIHHADFTLTDDQQAVLDVFAGFFERECPPQRVRDAEPDGYDADLWKVLLSMGGVSMGVPVEAGGDGAELVDLVLMAEQWGKSLAPVPLVDAIVAARLLARVGAAQHDGAAAEWLAGALDGSKLVTVALHRAKSGRQQLVPSGAIADAVVALVDGSLVIYSIADGATPVPNQGHTPLAWIDPSAGDITQLATGADAAEAFAEALRDWRLLMAAALTGMTERVLAISVEHAIERIAFGVPIGSFQAVAHPIVDVAMNHVMSQRLTRKAAWWADTDPAEQRELIPMAYRFAEDTAVHGSIVGVHTLGGVGFTVESDVQLYFRRAKGWTLALGDPEQQLDDIADQMFGPIAQEAAR